MPKKKTTLKKSLPARRAKKSVQEKINKKAKKAQETQEYSPAEWLKKEAKRVSQEFKEYAPDLKLDSGKSAEHCAITAMTLAHHGTKESVQALKNFKKDKRAPGWIDCAIDEGEMFLWDNTIGRNLRAAEEKLIKAVQEIFSQGLVWEKRMIMDALKVILKQQGTKFTYGETVKLYSENKAIAEDKAEFIIDDVLLVSIKPRFAEWLIRFKQGLEGKDLRQGDLENIEQGLLYDDDGKELEEPRSLEESFNDFYSRQFQCLLQMSKKEQGILLDFFGEKIYGQYFSLRHESGWHTDFCSGSCESCLQELKCSTAVEWKTEEDKKRYRVLKQLIKEIVQIEEKIEATKRPSNDIEYKMEIAKKIKNNIQEKIKQEKDKEKVKKLEEDLYRWDLEIAVLHDRLILEQPRPEETEELKTLKEMYQTVKQELETKEYKNDVEGLEVYYGKAKPSSPEAAACYHDPLCECDEYEPLSMEESSYKCDGEKKVEEVDFNDLSSNIEDLPLEEVPF